MAVEQKKTSWFSNLFTYKQMVHQQQFEIDAEVPFNNHGKGVILSQKQFM